MRSSVATEKAEKESLEKVIVDLNLEIEQMGLAQDALEKRMEDERKSAMEVKTDQ